MNLAIRPRRQHPAVDREFDGSVGKQALSDDVDLGAGRGIPEPQAAERVDGRDVPPVAREPPPSDSPPMRRSSFQVRASQMMIPPAPPAAMKRPSGEKRYSATQPMPSSIVVTSPVEILMAWNAPPGPLATRFLDRASNSTDGIEPAPPRVKECTSLPVAISMILTVPSVLPPVASHLPSWLTASAHV
jgi:hypothetical protein